MESTLIALDQKHLWHPFTQAKTAPIPLEIVRGRGSLLFDAQGRSFIDAISSWWVNLHGHCHPYINEAISRQLNTLEHVLFAGCTHLPAALLAERLVHIAPRGLSRVFFSDNGSTAVETALKIALQSFSNCDPHTKRKTVVAFENSYHGDTFGAMSAAGENCYNKSFASLFFKTEKIPFSLDAAEKVIAQESIAAFIFEPLVQAAGGMKLHSPNLLKELMRLCKHHGVLTIADEVMTGFGRTGPLFALEKVGETPDLLCLSKGITGGYLPLGATLAKEELFEKFYTHTFLHGHSYTANPLVCTAALASLDLLLKSECTLARKRIETAHKQFLSQHKMDLLRGEVLGTLLVLEFSFLPPSTVSFFLERGILIRPLGNVLYLLPPYCITEGEMNHVYNTIELFYEHLQRQPAPRPISEQPLLS